MTYSGAVDLRANWINRLPPCCLPPCYERGISGKEANEGGNERTAFEHISRLGVRYWQRRPLFLHLFNHKAQYQKRYWPNSYPNSQPLCMSFLKDRS
jgi:hypothetical protein